MRIATCVRAGLLALVAALALGFAAPDAWAHGGQFKAPGGAVDPGQRQPEDPTPPPAPPPSGPPTTGTPSDPKPGGSGPTTPPPTAPPATTPSGPTSLGDGPGKRQGGTSFDEWIFWYAYNNSEIENLKLAIYTRIGTDNALAAMGENAANESDNTQDVKSKVQTELIPALLWARFEENTGYTDTQSAAYIGLAKITRDPTHIDILRETLERKEGIMRESGLLAMGLLRRQKVEDQFSASDLDRVRDTLFSALHDDKKFQTRDRAFAAFALGLLGDQRTGAPPGATAEDGTRALVKRLFDSLERSVSAGDNQEVTVAIVTALGLHPPTAFTAEQRAILADCVVKGKLFKADATLILPSECAATLGRIGGATEAGILRRALVNRRTDRFTESSAAIALGMLAGHLTSEERVDLAKELVINLRKIKNTQATNFAMISLAYIANADILAGKTAVLTQSPVAETLLKTATDGRVMERPYAALALGLICRAIGTDPTVDAYGEFRHKALGVLVAGVESGKMSARDQSAFVMGLGIAQDQRSIGRMMDILKDRKGNIEKQGYAAIALGLIRQGPYPDAWPIIQAHLTGTTNEEFKVRCATALALLRDREAVPLLLRELDKAETQSLKGQLAQAIAKIGDGRAIPDMIKIVRDKSEKDLTRAIVTAALGVIGDLELIPSLARISENINYRAMNDSRNEIVSIL